MVRPCVARGFVDLAVPYGPDRGLTAAVGRTLSDAANRTNLRYKKARAKRGAGSWMSIDDTTMRTAIPKHVSRLAKMRRAIITLALTDRHALAGKQESEP